ncbi:MBL fold metallo-hydrolase [Streptomyces sp. NPDC001581]|uniref:MBL fold metallo-hydrolase n=1 Tax=Streptomyces sp. NPDC001581 TaxID=3154386 RepID=UPI00331796AA
MTTAIRIEVLPARQGDCLLVECPREAGPSWRMLVDGGPPATWPLLEQRLSRLPSGGRDIDVAVVTHIDSDHIGGMIPFLRSEYAGHVGDFWFNGRTHLPRTGAKRGVAQGERLMAALLGESGGPELPWNRAFDGGPVETGYDGGFTEVPTQDGPRITVLSPTLTRLESLGHAWSETVRQARRGRAEEAGPDILEPLDDVVSLSEEKTSKDPSVANGSSIALLVEHRGAGLVLGADAFGTVLGTGLQAVAEARGLDTLPVDAFKLPHHASKGNVLRALLRAAPARHYLVSTNGDLYHHPDDVALARVVLGAPSGAALWFNYRTDRTARWAAARLCEEYRYTAHFPEDPGTGAVLELPARS